MKNFKVFLITGIVMLLTACGGGGGGGGGSNESDNAPSKSMTTISDQNADDVIAATVRSLSGAIIINDIFGSGVSSSISKSPYKIHGLSKNAFSDLSTEASFDTLDSGTVSCSGGGSLSYDGNEETGGTVIFNECVEYGLTMDGKEILTFNGDNIISELIEFTIKIDGAEAYYKNAIMHSNEYNTDFSLTMTGYAIENSSKYEFENYEFSKIGNSYTFNGWVKSDCMSGWIEIITTQTLEIRYDCPTAGEIIAIGNNSELKITFNADQTVDAFINGELYNHYSSCKELPSPNDICYVDDFQFIDVTGAELSTSHTSNSILIRADGDVIVSTNSGILIKNGSEHSDSSITTVAGDTIRVKLDSSSSFSTTVSASVTIGSETRIYSVTTTAEDSTVDDFHFIDATDAELSTAYTSNQIAITGINTDITVSTSNGTIIKNNIELGAGSATAVEGDTIRVELDSSSSFSTTVSASVTIGSENRIYSVTTMDKLFRDIEIAEESTYYTSNGITIINNNTAVRIDNGILIKNGIELGTLATAANSGDTIKIKLLTGASLGDVVTSNVSVGNTIDTFSITTRPNNYDFIANGIYATHGLTFYYLVMPANGNVDFTENSNYSTVTIYDPDMNPLDQFGYSKTVTLSAGSYIVKIENRYSSDSVTIYSPLLDTKNDFPQITNGVYATQGLTFHYLTMPANGNVDFTENSNYSTVTIYDPDMNPLDQFGYSKTVTLSAGSYIVKIENRYSSDSVTIYSPLLDTKNDFPQITNGVYATQGLTFHYLTMPANGNVDFTENSNYSTVTIYDPDMNPLDQFGYSKTVTLSAGSYIVKIENRYSSDSVTIYSTLL